VVQIKTRLLVQEFFWGIGGIFFSVGEGKKGFYCGDILTIFHEQRSRRTVKKPLGRQQTTAFNAVA
jgi:hypothetical protein